MHTWKIFELRGAYDALLFKGKASKSTAASSKMLFIVW